MNPTGDNKNKIETIHAELEAQKLTQMVKLSEKSLWATIALGIVFPIGGYIYTRRWLSGLGFMLGGMGLAIAVYAVEPDQYRADPMAFTLCSLYGAIVSPLDNSRAISRARERVSDLSE
ncbi:hypothetical protein PMG71_05975 [Roseofilum sp. BLCC_M154]|uniref:Uncharacterized protein n=1 Tax=Roseofilum acuticapitatum BLCC-M154 TaxID=3022444 RepID=A0ABT7ASE3_9CYAN|nr:hypothetical protein [Roseofilum acuticapitatum]MDJ1168968.1 hypothetical protein [Roseofilum acuticapitatum BLCC-M154]